MIVESNSANNFITLPVSQINELKCLHEAEVHIWRRLSQLSAREEFGRAALVLLALVELFQSGPLIFRDLLKVIRVLEDVEIVDHVKLLVAHFEYVEQRWTDLIILQFDYLKQIRILSALPHLDGSISKSYQYYSNWILEWETDAGNADDIIRLNG